MTADDRVLPDGFEPLEPFVSTWAIDDLAGRDALRVQVAAKERQAFYEVASPLLEQALDYLDAKSPASYDDCDKRLKYMVLSLAHAALVEEIQREDEPRHAYLRSFAPFTSTSISRRA